MRSQGIITNYHYDNNEWYTTKIDNEEIFFKNKNNEDRIIESIIISSETSLKIQLFRTNPNGDIGYESDIIFIPASSNFSTSTAQYNGIRVIGLLGQKIRWVGNFV